MVYDEQGVNMYMSSVRKNICFKEKTREYINKAIRKTEAQ